MRHRHSKGVFVVYLKFEFPERPIFYLAARSQDNSSREAQEKYRGGKRITKNCITLLYYFFQKGKIKNHFCITFLKSRN